MRRAISMPRRAMATGVGAVLAVHGDVELLAQYGELLRGGGAVHVAGHQHRRAPLGLEMACQLRAAGGLAGALEARHQDDGRGL